MLYTNKSWTIPADPEEAWSVTSRTPGSHAVSRQRSPESQIQIATRHRNDSTCWFSNYVEGRGRNLLASPSLSARARSHEARPSTSINKIRCTGFLQQIIQEKVRTALSYLIGRAHVLCTFRTVPVCLQACCILRVYVNAGPTCIQK